MSCSHLPHDFLLRLLTAQRRDDADDIEPIDDGDDEIPDGFHEVSDEEMSRDPSEAPPPIDFAPFLDAVRQAGNWLLDVARSRTSDTLDLSAIERVQRAMRAALDGAHVAARPDLTEEDALVVLGLLITAFEIDLSIPGLGHVVGSVYEQADGDLGLIKARAKAVVQRFPTLARRAPRLAHGVSARDGVVRRVLIIR